MLQAESDLDVLRRMPLPLVQRAYSPAATSSNHSPAPAGAVFVAAKAGLNDMSDLAATLSTGGSTVTKEAEEVRREAVRSPGRKVNSKRGASGDQKGF